MRAGLWVEHRGPGVGIALWEHVVASVWLREPTLDDLARLETLQHRALQRHECIASLTVLRYQLRMTIDERVRHKSAAMTRAFAPRMYGAAVVVEDTSMRGTIFRSIMTGINLLSRTKSPTQVFDEVDDASQWLLERPGSPEPLQLDGPRFALDVLELAEDPEIAMSPMAS